MALIELRNFPTSPEPNDKSLHQAVKQGDLYQVQMLLEQGVNLDQAGKDFLTPLCLAVQIENIKIVRLLIEAGAQINSGYYLPLVLATQIGQFEIVRFLIESGADINRQQGDPPSITTLHMAASYNRLKIVHCLLANGAEIEARDFEGWTPLMSAVAKGSIEVVKLLIEVGADINAVGRDQYSVLDIAMQNRRSKISQFLRDKGAKHGQELL